MTVQLQAGEFDDKLLALREPGLSFVVSDSVVGALPGHRCTVLELRLEFDPSLSVEHLVMRTLVRDKFSGAAKSSRRDVCRALPISKAPEDRQIYVREMCQMIAPHVRLHSLTLEQLEPAVLVMNSSWNILGVFCELDSLGAQLLDMHAPHASPLDPPALPEDHLAQDSLFTPAELAQLVCVLERQADLAHGKVGLQRTLTQIGGTRHGASADTLANHVQAQAWTHLALKARRMLAASRA